MFTSKQTITGAIVWCIKSWPALRSVRESSQAFKSSQVRSAFYTQTFDVSFPQNLANL